MSNTFTCPICGRTVDEVPRMVSTDSRSPQQASDELPDQPLEAPPFCSNGHTPIAMAPD